MRRVGVALNAWLAARRRVVLPEQPWILDDKLTVQKALDAELGKGTRIEAFRRVRLGG